MTPLEMVSELLEQYEDELNGFMNDEEYKDALELAVKLIAKPNVPQDRIASLCVQLEAYAYIFRTKFVAFQSFKKGENSIHKKNMYKEAYTGLDRLVDSLKYLMK